MPNHHQTLARLNELVGEAHELCARAENLRPEGTVAVGVAVPIAFQTVLGRQISDWMNRAETTVRTVKPDGDKLCGRRAGELRCLIDAANVAIMMRHKSGEPWISFHRLVRSVPLPGD